MITSSTPHITIILKTNGTTSKESLQNWIMGVPLLTFRWNPIYQERLIQMLNQIWCIILSCYSYISMLNCESGWNRTTITSNFNVPQFLIPHDSLAVEKNLLKVIWMNAVALTVLDPINIRVRSDYVRTDCRGNGKTRTIQSIKCSVIMALLKYCFFYTLIKWYVNYYSIY